MIVTVDLHIIWSLTYHALHSMQLRPSRFIHSTCFWRMPLLHPVSSRLGGGSGSQSQEDPTISEKILQQNLSAGLQCPRRCHRITLGLGFLFYARGWGKSNHGSPLAKRATKTIRRTGRCKEDSENCNGLHNMAIQSYA